MGLLACSGDDKPASDGTAAGAAGSLSGTSSGASSSSGGSSSNGAAAGKSSGGKASSAGSSSDGGKADGGTPTMTPPGSEPTPMPVISNNVPAFASSSATNSSPAAANDGMSGSAWLAGSIPAWLAYDLSGASKAQRKQVLVAWYVGAALDFINPTPDASKHWPIDYTIETNSAAGGGDPPADGWTIIETVTGNDRNTRQRLLDMADANWVRINVTKSSSPDTVGIDMDVHSAPEGATDSWLFMGDSITFMSTSYLFSNLPSLVHGLAPDRWPAIIPAAIGGTNTTTALDAIDTTIANFPGRFVTLNYGTNDHAGEYHMEELVKKVIAAGKVPVVPKMPWAAASNIQTDGPLINQQIDELYAKYPEIRRGPDMWEVFKDRTDLIPADDIHPNSAGQDEWRKQWSISMTQ